MNSKEQKVLAVLRRIIPLLDKHSFKWVITGGFACYVYGVERPMTDIDIDIDASKDTADFQALMSDLKDSITQPLEHFVDQNYDNYNFEATFDGVVVDICPMKEMKIFDKRTGSYENFYKSGFPEYETANFFGLNLPLLSKRLIIENKEMLAWKRESDLKDIEHLKKMIVEKSA